MTVFARILLWTVFCISAGTVFCQTWTQTTAVDTNWSSLVSSADGSILAACGGTTNLQAIYISTNSGTAWAQTTLPMTNSTFALALSADGTRIFAGRNLPNKPEFVNATNLTPFFYSTNSGQSWITMGDATTNLITSVAMSGDGSVLVAGLMSRSGRTNLVCISTNSGVDWSTNPMPVLYPRCKAVANGQTVTVMLSGTLLVTTNAGAAWVTNNLPGSPYSWGSYAASADGSKIALVGHYSYAGTSFALSTNAGASWNARAVNGSVYASGTIAASADGSKLILPASSGLFFVSTNFGTDWFQMNGLNTNWGDVVLSADGNKMAATAGQSMVIHPQATAIVVGTGGIWNTFSPPAPALNIASGSNVALSWTLPSTNLALQMCSDLSAAGWNTVTNPATLNLTNLKYQITLPLRSGNTFFRLGNH